MEWWVWTIVAVAILLMFTGAGLGLYLFTTREIEQPKEKEDEKFDSSSLLQKRTSEYGTIAQQKNAGYDVVPPYQYGVIPEKAPIYAGFPQPEGYGEIPTENVYEATSSVLD